MGWCEDEGVDIGEDSKIVEVYVDDVDDEDGEKEVVDEVDFFLDFWGLVDVGEIDI